MTRCKCVAVVVVVGWKVVGGVVLVVYDWVGCIEAMSADQNTDKR